MEKNQFFSPVVTGVLGIVTGAVIMYFVNRTDTNINPITNSCPPTLTHQQATLYKSNFKSQARPYLDTLKGFNVDVQEVNAMKCLLDRNSQLAGFRVYFGRDNAGTDKIIIVGVNNTGKDDRTLYYYVTHRLSGPCPPTCDL
jgi:hypothetical protein